MKWLSSIYIIPVALVIVLLVGWGFYKNLDFWKPRPQAVNQITLTPMHSSSPVSTFSASPSSTIEGWKVFVSDMYKFQFSYPDAFFYGGIFTPSCHTNPTSFSMRLRCVANLTYVRGPGGDEQYETVIISLADKDLTSTLAQWVTAPNSDLHLHDIPQGDITNALAKTYAKQKELSENIRNPGYIRSSNEFVTHNERIEKGMEILELGAVLNSGGRLSYTTLLTKSGLKYVYSVELFMEPGKFATKPGDQELIEMYKRIVSTFQFTK